MVTLDTLREEVHLKTLQLRKLERLVESQAFAKAYSINNSDPLLHFAISDCNLGYIEEWIKQTLRFDISEMPLRDLRNVASRLGIANYTRYDKDLLLILIAQAHDRQLKEAIG